MNKKERTRINSMFTGCLMLIVIGMIAMTAWNIQLQKKINFLNRASTFALMTDNGRDNDMIGLWNEFAINGKTNKLVNWDELRYENTNQYRVSFLIDSKDTISIPEMAISKR